MPVVFMEPFDLCNARFLWNLINEGERKKKSPSLWNHLHSSVLLYIHLRCRIKIDHVSLLICAF